MPARPLRGSVSLVTGGGRGIGRAIALALARAGSSVAVLARSRDELDETVSMIEAEGGRAAAWTVDVTDRAAVEAAVDAVEQAFGPLSLLVNNAGTSAGGGPLWETDPDDWWRGVEINLRGPYLFCRSVLPGMIARRAGRIVNVATHVAMTPWPKATAYASSKAGLLRMSDSLAVSVRDHGVRVFAISPGFVWTDMTRRIMDEHARRDAKSAVPSAREAFPPELAAGLVVRLASGEADALTGRYFHVKDDFDAIVRDAARVESEDLLALRFNEWRPRE